MSVQQARGLRKHMSPAEALMWNLLRGEPFREWHFRRQVPLGRFFAGFASHRANLVIEVDGDTHAKESALVRDADRSRFMDQSGYRVVRFSNHDVLNHSEGVAETLSDLLTDPPTPAQVRRPSP